VDPTPYLVALGSALLTLGASLWGIRKFGLTDIAKLTKAEGDRLVSVLKDRVLLLEKANEELRVENRLLHDENALLTRRVDDLERALSDGIIIKIEKAVSEPR
jgi:hypothetical protein